MPPDRNVEEMSVLYPEFLSLGIFERSAIGTIRYLVAITDQGYRVVETICRARRGAPSQGSYYTTRDPDYILRGDSDQREDSPPYSTSYNPSLY
jgi:hypothetical protein